MSPAIQARHCENPDNILVHFWGPDELEFPLSRIPESRTGNPGESTKTTATAKVGQPIDYDWTQSEYLVDEAGRGNQAAYKTRRWDGAEPADNDHSVDSPSPRSLLSTPQEEIGQTPESVAPADVDGRTDEQLLDDYRNGDSAAFHRIIGRYREDLYFFLFRFMHDQASTEDGLQETFLRVHQFADQFDAGRSFRPWLFSIAANWARDILRTRDRKSTVSLQLKLRTNNSDGGELSQLIAADVEAPDHRMESSEIQDRVQSTLQAMPLHLRQILEMAYFQQFCYQEIATTMGIPVGTVKSRLHAAVGHFAEQWEQRHGPIAEPRRAARSRRPSVKRPPLPTGFTMHVA